MPRTLMVSTRDLSVIGRVAQCSLKTCRPDHAGHIRASLRELHEQTKSTSFYSRCSLRSAPPATRGSACMSVANLTAVETQRASIAATFPAGDLALLTEAVRKDLDAQLQAAVRSATSVEGQATGQVPDTRKAYGLGTPGSSGSAGSAEVDFLRATCPGLVPASANRSRQSSSRRPATVPKTCIIQAGREDSAFYIPTR